MSFTIPDLKTAEEWLEESSKALKSEGIILLQITEERFQDIEYLPLSIYERH